MKGKTTISAKISRAVCCLFLVIAMLCTSFGSYASAATTTTSGKSSDKTLIYNYLVTELGFNDAVACGIMANIKPESSFNSANLQGTYEKKLGFTDASYTKAVDNGSYTKFATDSAGYGLLQWTSSGEKKSLLTYAQEHGKSISDVYMQLDFVKYHLKDIGYWKKYFADIPNTAQGAYDAAYLLCYWYERPASKAVKAVNRGNSAKDTFWPEYAGTAKASTSSSGKTTGSSTTSSTTSASSSNKYSTGTYQVTACSLYVRKEADKTSGIRGTVKYGQSYQVTEVKNGKWGKITYKDKTGWISLDYCKKVSTDSSSSTKGTTYKVTASRLNIRSKADTDSKVLGSMAKGKTFTVTETNSDGWGKVTCGGKTGWVCLKYAKKQ